MIRAVAWAFAQDLPPTPKLVLVALADYANGNGQAWPSQETLAAKCGLSERAVRDALRLLQQRLLVRQFQRKGTPGNRLAYGLLLDNRAAREPAPPAGSTRAEPAPPAAANRHLLPVPSEPSEEPTPTPGLVPHDRAPAKPEPHPAAVEMGARLVAGFRDAVERGTTAWAMDDQLVGAWEALLRDQGLPAAIDLVVLWCRSAAGRDLSDREEMRLAGVVRTYGRLGVRAVNEALGCAADDLGAYALRVAQRLHRERPA